jgi:hypothetical protein
LISAHQNNSKYINILNNFFDINRVPNTLYHFNADVTNDVTDEKSIKKKQRERGDISISWLV